MPLRLVIATSNPDKRRELRALLEGLEVDILTLDHWPEYRPPPETGGSLEENAHLKALSAARHTGLLALGDDTGLEVDALDGQPGVFSARFAGELASYADNRAKLLAALEGVPTSHRTAAFRTVAVLCSPDGTCTVVHGVCEGLITAEERGSGGFGYDAIFYVPSSGLTFAEMDETQKNAVSHRGMALARMREVIAERLHETATSGE